jgi:hypothetical protein
MALLRRVETHVRIMAERDNISATDRSLDYRDPSLPFGGSFAGFTQVHRDDNQYCEKFFQRSLLKIAGNAAAGQSHTVLICGPPRSGRSQTMYDVMGKGAVHLMADALLAIPDVVVHYTAHHVRGPSCYDSFTDKPIAFTEVPAPVGAFPLSTVKELGRAGDAVVVPAAKKATSSCIIAFHVYKRSAGSDAPQRKDAFAIVTFVDLCSFEDNCAEDLNLLSSTIDKVARGSDPEFDRCMLTRLLQASLVGGRTLTLVTAVTGSKSTARAACAALDFTLRAGKIGQIAPLCQLVAPRWQAELPADAHQAAAELQTRAVNAQQRGVAAAYSCILSLVSQKQASCRVMFGENEGIAAVRHRLRSNVGTRLQDLQSGDAFFEDRRQRLQQDQKRCRAEADDLERRCADLQHRLRDQENALHNVQAIRNDLEAASQLEIARCEADVESALRTKRDIDQREAAFNDAIAMADGHESMLADRVRRAALVLNRDNALNKLDTKRKRIEAALDDAAHRAKEVQERLFDDRQRKSAAARVSRAEAKVNAKAASLATLRGTSEDAGEREGFSPTTTFSRANKGNATTSTGRAKRPVTAAFSP